MPLAPKSRNTYIVAIIKTKTCGEWQGETEAHTLGTQESPTYPRNKNDPLDTMLQNKQTIFLTRLVCIHSGLQGKIWFYPKTGPPL